MLWKLCKWMMKSYTYVSDDVLEEVSAARYQILPKKSKLRYQKELEKFTRNENQWAKAKWTKEKPSPTGNYGYRLTF
jgi:hypothetical protein